MGELRKTIYANSFTSLKITGTSMIIAKRTFETKKGTFDYYSTPILATHFGKRVSYWLPVRFKAGLLDNVEIGKTSRVVLNKGMFSTDGKKLYLMIIEFELLETRDQEFVIDEHQQLEEEYL